MNIHLDTYIVLFVTNVLLKMQVRKEHGRYCSKNPKYKKVSCCFCKAVYTTNTRLKGHMRKHHNVRGK